MRGSIRLANLSQDVLRRRAHHVISEIQRVRDVVAHLDAGHPTDIGGYLTASHESLRDDFEVSCDELDVAVEAALSAGALGARMTGGGFGGCVVSLCRDTDSDGDQATGPAGIRGQRMGCAADLGAATGRWCATTQLSPNPSSGSATFWSSATPCFQ